METISYAQLKKLGYTGYLLESAPEKVLQFGEGNFLRAFVDYWFDVSNEKTGWNGKCVLVQPISTGLADTINDQEGLYTLYLRGMENGEKVDRKRVISSVSRCLDPYREEGFRALMEVAVSEELEFVVSNTTEAGIVYDPACRLDDRPCASFPGKLTQVLYRRFRAGKGGLVILSCELIDNNGAELKKCVLQYVEQWGLEADFRDYVENACTFCSTLVDRIVPGRIRDAQEVARLERENGYRDPLGVVGEVFGIWNIEGPAWLEEKLPFKAAGVNCTVVPDVTPYKKRKVRILNGAHTGFVPGGYLAGFRIVRDCMENDVMRRFMNQMLHKEIIPTLPLDKADLLQFADAVQDRFMNPFVDHELMSISLNCTSKWRARNLPSLLSYVEQEKKLPRCLVMSFAAYIAFFSWNIRERTDGGLVCRRPQGDDYVCMDDGWVLEFYYDRRDDEDTALVHDVMTNTQMWGMDLTGIDGFEAATVEALHKIKRDGVLAAFADCLEDA